MTDTTKPTPTPSEFADADGHFRRPVSSFRSFVSAEPGAQFAPEAGRYHLYVSYGCPWAHRTLVVRALKGLEDVISLSVVSPHLSDDRKWPFKKLDSFPGATEDHILGKADMSEVYLSAEPNYTGRRFTVPVLYDTKLHTIVNNESSEIIRIFNRAFNALLPAGSAERALDLLPPDLEKEIDALNAWVYDTVNNGVYKTGFAGTQEAYEAALFPLFASLDRLEALLSSSSGPYLFGSRLTEADVRLYTTIVRFDVAYHGNFKCNLRSIRHDYPHLNKWLRNLYWNNKAFGGTTRFDHIKGGYYWMKNLNPSRIVPVGPVPDVEPL
ncbi:glutathione S-transferase [Calocera viscosa TUFC12733]|uniref:Glutathione S-transferase n=1 Tax=Calocera viscosa (strain TUFC12733) TaxID=1330018 RepID=A0A167GXB7_CALVF|nr:glutathione S-transferase [Calocera viscosa TUFC12733]